MQQETRKKFFFAATSLLVLVSIVWNVYYNFTNYYYGFEINLEAGVEAATVTEVDDESPAARAGLQVGDEIKSINSHKISQAVHSSWESFSRELRTGQLELEVEREGKALTIALRSELPNVSLAFFAFLIIGLLFIVMGLWVFLARLNYKAATVWGFFALLMGGFVTSVGAEPSYMELIHLFIGILTLGQFFFAIAAGLHFSLIFPKESKLSKRKWIIPIIYTLPTIILLFSAAVMLLSYFMQYMGDIINELQNIVGVMVSSFWVIYFSLIIIAMIASYLGTSELTEKRRIRAIIFGTTIPLAMILLLFFSYAFLNFHLPYPDVTIAVILGLIPITSFYAIVRHRAMQIELILKRGLIYSMVTGAVLLATGIVFIGVFGLMLLLQDMLPNLGRRGGTYYNLATNENVQKFLIAVWSVLVGARIGSIKNRMQTFVDRRFYRARYSYRQALEKLTSILEQTHDRRKMMEIVIDNAEEMVHPRSVAIVVEQPENGGLVEQSVPEALSQITLKPDSMIALKKAFKGRRKFLGMHELHEEQFDDAELIHAAFIRLGADICLPLRVESGILGFILLGKKRSETSYNLEEIDLLKLLADQAAIGIEHMALAAQAAEKETIQHELEIGRQMQRSLLPLKTPSYPGLEIAALNLPALEVGGDFYTFVEYGSGRLGVIIGDIVGKGVGGALNMAVAISSLRLIAEESSSVSEAMQRFNRYLVRNTNSRSFAAVIFAIIDLNKRTLRWSNGGLPDPVLISADGEARYLENEIYPLPPGASPHSIYLESEQKLRPGDNLLLITDGIIEAMPDDGLGNMFGFDRLLTHLSNGTMDDPKKMVDQLCDEVRSFSGKSHLDDDITLVALHLDSPDKQPLRKKE